jgi:hypothetical protein
MLNRIIEFIVEVPVVAITLLVYLSILANARQCKHEDKTEKYGSD